MKQILRCLILISQQDRAQSLFISKFTNAYIPSNGLHEAKYTGGIQIPHEAEPFRLRCNYVAPGCITVPCMALDYFA